MTNAFVSGILELPVQDRMQLLELIWDSIALAPQSVPVPPALKAELAVRLEEFKREPEAGYSWDQAKAKFKDGSWRTA